MGKFANSQLHDQYSDWHWGLTKIDERYRRLYLTDIDRMWIETTADGVPIALFDLKYANSLDEVSHIEFGAYKWFSDRGVLTFVVYCEHNGSSFDKFKVRELVTKNEKEYTPIQYAEFLYRLHEKYVGINNE